MNKGEIIKYNIKLLARANGLTLDKVADGINSSLAGLHYKMNKNTWLVEDLYKLGKLFEVEPYKISDKKIEIGG